MELSWPCLHLNVAHLPTSTFPSVSINGIVLTSLHLNSGHLPAFTFHSVSISRTVLASLHLNPVHTPKALKHDIDLYICPASLPGNDKPEALKRDIRLLGIFALSSLPGNDKPKALNHDVRLNCTFALPAHLGMINLRHQSMIKGWFVHLLWQPTWEW